MVELLNEEKKFRDVTSLCSKPNITGHSIRPHQGARCQDWHQEVWPRTAAMWSQHRPMYFTDSPTYRCTYALTNMLRQNGSDNHTHAQMHKHTGTHTQHTLTHTQPPLLGLVNKHSAIKAGLLLIRVLWIRQEMLGKLHLIVLELANHHHGNGPTSLLWEDQNTIVAEGNWDRTNFPK